MCELECKLKELCAQYRAVIESSAPEPVREVQGKVIKQQIDDLLQDNLLVGFHLNRLLYFLGSAICKVRVRRQPKLRAAPR